MEDKEEIHKREMEANVAYEEQKEMKQIEEYHAQHIIKQKSWPVLNFKYQISTEIFKL